MGKVIKERLYTIHWCTSNGYCYRTTMGCPKSYVDSCKRIAKRTGDVIKTELEKVVSYEY